jgi:DNA-binding NarL/FixJ family response regulator
MRDTPTDNPRGPVLIVDGDRDYTAFVAEALQRAGFVSHVAATAQAAVSFAREHHPAAVILDVILPGATGYELCRQLRDEHADAFPIVFVTAERTEPPDRVVGLLIGADDYLLKPIDADELIARLRRLIARSARTERLSADAQGISELTSRESEVLRLLAQGLNQEAIAVELEISPATVGTHIQRILNKLDVHSRTQAVAVAYRERLVERV